ncbi:MULTISPECIES: DUF7848 domain-containing protein [Streptomyces]|uniref:DUF7848 domain-containing protein n=1 Tax=Streptomyces TaxID=1883 RepID=UPI0004CDB685|nr:MULTISPECIES: hypothetical protein [Streptomyces]KOT58978.1 hypothetical protein ADK43_17645 [Streptomyces rimosus subsp. rimosus]
MRSTYRFTEWALSAIPGAEIRYYGKCLECFAQSTDTEVPDEAQLWCLKHAGLSRCTRYEVHAFQHFDARPTDSPAAVRPN